MLPKFLYKKYKSDFLKYYAAEQTHKHSTKDLEPSYIDSNGKQHYRYPEGTSLPMCRLSKLIEFSMWLNAGLTGEELEKILDQIDAAVMNGIKNNKGAAVIGFLTTEARKRRGMVLPMDLLCSYIAIQNVREDEEADIYNNAIHKEKVSQIKEEIEKGNGYFFLDSPELKKLANSLTITIDELMKRVDESGIKVEALSEMLSLLQLQNGSKGKE